MQALNQPPFGEDLVAEPRTFLLEISEEGFNHETFMPVRKHLLKKGINIYQSAKQNNRSSGKLSKGTKRDATSEFEDEFVQEFQTDSMFTLIDAFASDLSSLAGLSGKSLHKNRIRDKSVDPDDDRDQHLTMESVYTLVDTFKTDVSAIAAAAVLPLADTVTTQAGNQNGFAERSPGDLLLREKL